MKRKLKKLIRDFISECSVYPESTDYKGILYHFTDIESLKNILSERKLRFTYFSHLNDCNEIKFGLDIITELMSNNDLRNTKLFNQLLTTYITPENQCLNTFICSFSKEINHLPLWRFYGNNGFGVAIGFDPKIPLENEKSLQKHEIPTRANVLYGSIQLTKILSDKISQISTIFQHQEFISANAEQQLEMERKVYVGFGSFIIPYLLTVKHDDYITELEARLLLMDGKLRDIKNYKHGCKFTYHNNINNYKFKSMNSAYQIEEIEIKDKTKLFVESAIFKKEAVKEIWVGQNCKRELETNIRNYLDKLGFSNSITIERYKSSFVG